MNIRDNRGQALVMTLVFLTVLLGSAAMSLDVGSWYHQKRQLQAASLAGGNGSGMEMPGGGMWVPSGGTWVPSGGMAMPDSGTFVTPPSGAGSLPAPVAAPPLLLPASSDPVAVAGDMGPANTGLRITELAANGPAAQQGLQVGDVIVRADGIPTHTGALFLG